jgi:hypothetical protein
MRLIGPAGTIAAAHLGGCLIGIVLAQSKPSTDGTIPRELATELDRVFGG